MVKTYIPKREPLRIEHERFIESIVSHSPLYVTGEDGRAALGGVALRLIASGRENEVAR